jgi:SagB-type dehydrogenase family enzyme
MKENRKFLKFYDQEEYDKVVPESDEQKKIPPPLFEQPYPKDAKLIDLVPHEDFKIGKTPFLSIVNTRKSRRKYTEDPITLEELSFLLWSTQGLKRQSKSGRGVFRTVPSSGAKSPFETYLVINRVEGLKPGLYRYISFVHKLLYIKEIEEAEKTIGELAYNQKFVGKAAVIFFWTAVPYRTEWRYTILAHKYIAVDLGLLCQSLYLACEAIKLGTCAIGYYEQKKLDKLFELNPEEEFVVLVHPVGKYPKEKKITEFFKNPQAKVKTAEMKKLLGTYKNEKGEVEIIIEEKQLYAKLGDYKERFDPYNATEYEGEYLRAARFILTKDGKPKKVEILMASDEIVELVYQEEEDNN